MGDTETATSRAEGERATGLYKRRLSSSFSTTSGGSRNPYAMQRMSTRTSNHSSTHQQSPAYYSPYWVKVISGSVGSAVTALAVTPLEVVKVRLQSMAPAPSLPPGLPANVAPCPKGCGVFVFSCGISERLIEIPYSSNSNNNKDIHRLATEQPSQRGTFSMLRHIFKTEGVAGIYAGLAPTLVMGVPNTVLYFVSYDELIARFRTESNATWIPAAAGSAARLVASFSTAPLELIRTRQAGRSFKGDKKVPSKYSGLLQEMKYLIQKDGFFSLYRGLSPTLFRDAPFSAVYWLSIERLRDMWRSRQTGPDAIITPSQQFGQAFFNGSVAGMIAAACTTPLDVIKTRQQLGSPGTVQQPSTQAAVQAACEHEGMTAYQQQHKTVAATNNSTISLFRQILQTEGVPGLWRGNQTRMIKVAPACAVMLSSYEIGKRMLGNETV